MKTRLLSALVMIILGAPGLIFGGLPLYILLGVVACLVTYEIATFKDQKLNLPLFLITLSFVFSFYLLPKARIVLIPLLVILLIALSIFKESYKLSDAAISTILNIIIAYGLYACTYIYDIHKYLMIYICCVSLVTDAGAYFVGVFFGKTKLIERISPKKTVEGAYGGIAFGFLSSFIFAYFNGFFGYDAWFIAFNSLLLPIVSEIGDLAFSLIKRFYGVKDYSHIIPGHGGVLDRIDSVLFCLIFFVCMSVLFI